MSTEESMPTGELGSTEEEATPLSRRKFLWGAGAAVAGSGILAACGDDDDDDDSSGGDDGSSDGGSSDDSSSSGGGGATVATREVRDVAGDEAQVASAIEQVHASLARADVEPIFVGEE